MKLSLQLALILAATAQSGPLSAQTCVYGRDADPVGAASEREWLFSDVSGSSADLYYRSQFLVPAETFGTVPLLISDISVGVRRGWRLLHHTELTIKVGQTTASSLDSVFDDNITTPLRTVLEVRDHTALLGPNASWVPLGLQRPFWFVPGRGDLLIELVQFEPQPLSEDGWDRLGGTVVGEVIREHSTGAVPAQQLSSTRRPIPNFRFCVDHAELTTYGEGCVGTSTFPAVLGLSGSSGLGATTDVWLSNGRPNDAAILLFGVDNAPPFPRDLAPIGMPDCRLYFDIFHTVAVNVNGLGIASSSLAIPAASGLIGGVLYLQYLALDPGANTLGVITSNYGRVLIGR